MDPQARLILEMASISVVAIFVYVFSTLSSRKRRDNVLRLAVELERRKLYLAAEQSPNAIIVTDQSGLIEYVNPRFSTMTGYTREETLGRTPRIIKSGVSPDEEYRKLWQAIAAGGEWRGTFCNRKKSGELFWASTVISPIFDEHHAITHYVAVEEDVSDRMAAEQRLREVDTKLKYIVEHSTNLFYVHTLDHRLTYVSPQARQMLDCEPEEAMVRWTEFMSDHPENRRAVEATEKAMATGQAQPPYEIELRSRQGRTVWVEVHESPILIDGKVTGMAGSLTDVTLRREAEQALRLSEEKYRQIFEESRDVIFISTPGGRFVDINPAGLSLFGYTKDEIMAVDIESTLYPDPAERRRLSRELETTGYVQDFEEVLRRRDGSLVTVLETTTAMRDAGGRVCYYRGIIRDISGQKELEAQLQQSQKMEAIGQLAGGVAHDFNNLLTAILGYSDILLRRTDKDTETSDEIGEIKRAAERAASLTRQLLAFSRKQIMTMENLDLNDSVRNITKLLHRLIGEDIDLTTRIAPTPALIKADAGQIEQVILNLVVNARDAMPKGGKLRVTTEVRTLGHAAGEKHVNLPNGTYAVLSVSDTGCGMTPEIMSHIFEPFFTTKAAGKGTGLGLSTVYGIVKQTGGDIQVESEPGKGSTFRVFLPRASEEEQTTHPAETATTGKGAVGCILVIEDEPLVRNLIEMILTSAGYDVLAGGSGEEAIRIFEQNVERIDLVLTDVVMPQMDGRTLARQILERKPNQRILYMSGYTDHAIVHEGVLDQGLAFIQKPFTPENLELKIRTMLAG